jgi:hypothetical protein
MWIDFLSQESERIQFLEVAGAEMWKHFLTVSFLDDWPNQHYEHKIFLIKPMYIKQTDWLFRRSVTVTRSAAILNMKTVFVSEYLFQK